MIDFKSPKTALADLDTVLHVETAKLRKFPVKRDMVPGHEIAQAWGYVVAGYFLVEQALKLLLHLRHRTPRPIHQLSSLFAKLPSSDKIILREYYRDRRDKCDRARGFPFSTLDEFLLNLDGGTDDRGKHVGSLDWRYYLIERSDVRKMPKVSIELLHEVALGTIVIVECLLHGVTKPLEHTHSAREQRRRENAGLPRA